MKKILLIGAMILVLAEVILLGQVAQAKPPAYTLKEAEPGLPLHGEMTVQGKALGVIRTSIGAALTSMGWKVLSEGPGRPPMPAYSYAAVKYPTSDPNQRQGLFLDLEVNGGKITIIADWYLVAQDPKRPKAQAKQFYDAFFDKVAELLYGKVEK